MTSDTRTLLELRKAAIDEYEATVRKDPASVFPQFRKLFSAGWKAELTGGGCTALKFELPLEMEILVVSSREGMIPVSPKEPITVTVYHKGDEVSQSEYRNMRDFLCDFSIPAFFCPPTVR